MTFSHLILQILPLYFLILLGFIGGRFFHIDPSQVAKLVVQIIIPITFFNLIAKIDFSFKILLLPLLLYAIAILNSVVFYKIGKNCFNDSRKNVLAMSSGLANAGYFGLPIAMILFDEKTVSIYAISFMGLNFFEATFAYYYAHRVESSIGKSIIRVLKMPMFIGMVLGIFASYFSYKTPVVMERFFINITGAYATLGMLIVGMAISKIKEFKFDWLLISLTFLAKFVCWPLLSLGLIMLDKFYFGMFSSEYYKVIFLISIMPIAANAVVIASFFKLHHENMASSVFLSTIFALIYLPLLVLLVFPLL
jgi:predicted permease